MTVTESSQLLAAAPTSTPVQTSSNTPVAFDTTELRWFVRGPLPVDIAHWFAGSTGVLEQRCDAYLLDGRDDIGVKRRFRVTLELKIRQSLDGMIEFGDGLAGPLEEWRRWSPAEGLIDDGGGRRWIDVHKSVLKRRFLTDGTETVYSPVSEATGAGCDVEVADVNIGALRWWTFAFAAFGPPCTRPETLLASWQTLVTASPCPEPFGPRSVRASGYPEWVARCT